jgi:hypothetical protein
MKTKPKAVKRIVLGQLNMTAMTRGDGSCNCLEHKLLSAFPKLPLRVRLRLVAEVLK